MAIEFPVWLQWYKKPSFVDITQYADRLGERAERVERASTPASPRSSEESRRRSSADIPKKLKLERILNNRTCELEL